MQIHASLLSHIGNSRTTQEDNFLFPNELIISREFQKSINRIDNPLIRHSYSSDELSAVFAVSDGLGGHMNGEVASFLAMDALRRRNKDIVNAISLNDAIAAFQKYVKDINREIIENAHFGGDMSNMGATLAAVLIYDRSVVGFSIGDSRIYHFDGDNLTLMTRDNVNSYGLSEYLGYGDRFLVQEANVTDVYSPKSREWFLICSDGLCSRISHARICGVLKEYYDASKLDDALNCLLHEADSVDNITAIIIEIVN